MQPDRDAMLRFVEHLFGDQMAGRIEVAWTDADPPYKLRHANTYDVGDLEEVVECAAEHNATPGVNVYVGAALRKDETPPFGRSTGEDVLSLPALFVDGDDPDCFRRCKERYQACPPNMAVVTGTQPHKRIQLWWKLDEAIAEVDAIPETIQKLIGHFGTDLKIFDPPRVMAFGGSIKWPHDKPGREPEITTVKIPKGAAPTYPIEALQAHYLTDENLERFDELKAAAKEKKQKATTTNHDHVDQGITRERTSLGFEGQVVDGREEYMRDTLVACLREFIGENGRRPSTDELIDAAWPQYEAKVDLDRPGRGYDEFRDKAHYTLARFDRGEIDGCRSVTDAIDSHAQKVTQANSAPFGEPQIDDSADEDPEGPISAAKLIGEPPEREWLVKDWIPKHAITSLYGEGGVGKTLLGQELGTSGALGREWVGITVEKMRVLMVACEDEKDELHRRQNDINKHHGVVMNRDVRELYLWPRVGYENLLIHWNGGQRAYGKFYEQLYDQCDALTPDLLILDTAADLFGGNENDRAQVNHFVKTVLGRLVRQFNLSILLLAHPRKDDENRGYSGSTAWENAVRARLHLSRHESDKQMRVLSRMKANYADTDASIDLVWEKGVLKPIKIGTGQVDKIKLRNAIKAVVSAVRKAWDEGRPVGDKRNSPRKFQNTIAPALEDEFGKEYVFEALQQAKQQGYLVDQRTNKMRGLGVNEQAWEQFENEF